MEKDFEKSRRSRDFSTSEILLWHLLTVYPTTFFAESLIRKKLRRNFFDRNILKTLMALMTYNNPKNTVGEKVNWLKVKCFQYLKCKAWILQYRYDRTSEYFEINVFGKGRKITLVDF
jgi:hypothetical protein